VDDTLRSVEAVARSSYGRLVAYLSSRTRDVAAAEDALGDALLSALTLWPRDGVPRTPEAWLLTAARNRLIDQARRARVRTDHTETIRFLASQSQREDLPDEFPDERLKLFFVCAHPAIDPALHAPLMLQTVLGLNAARIAPAFLVPPATMSQRLVRAKTKIREAGIPFEVPEERELPQRLAAVLDAIYAAYGLGWDDAAGVDPGLRDLTEEAIWLSRVLKERIPAEPEIGGLLALMLFCEARRPARRTKDGRYVPLSEQDPARWNLPVIAAAEAELNAASRHARAGRFQLEAAIQSVHAERRISGRTDWSAIEVLYEHLVRMAPTVGALIAQAAATAEARGPEPGLARLDAIDRTAISSYQPYWAVRAHLLQQLGRRAEAAAAFERAIGLTEDDSVRRFLLDRRGSPPPASSRNSSR
jgi:predicted RNA polymerase sigma factor